jgi:flagellin FlaB
MNGVKKGKMRQKKRRSLRRDKRGFTGLEAAIVLTAFIVVAAVFSYMVLGAGFFSTEKAKSVIHTGVEKATSSAEVTGDVIGHGWLNGSVNASTGTWSTGGTTYYSYYAWGNSTSAKNKPDTTNLTVVEFQVELTAGQEALDMDKVVLSYSDDATYVAQLDYKTWGNASSGNLTQSATAGTWTYSLATTEMGEANMLDPNEKMTVIVALPADGVLVSKQFKIDFKPPKGGSVTITKTAPGSIDKTMVLH